MIILDTNVLSETVNTPPSGRILRWLAEQDGSEVFVTAITQAEMFYGVEAMPHGKRRMRLLAAAERLFNEDFRDRILAFEDCAARLYAKVVNDRRLVGRPISQMDAMIAAIARSLDATIATRNTKDFEHCGVQLINPWNE